LSFIDEVRKALEARSERLGFRKYKRQIVREVSSDATIRIGYGMKACPGGKVTLFVVVGLMLESVHKLGLQLSAYPEGTNNPTLSEALKYLVPAGVDTDYEFTPDENNDRVVDRVIQDVASYGLPLLETLTSVELALHAVEHGPLAKFNGRHQFLPLAHFLLGNKTEALNIAYAHLATVDRSRGTGADYAAFVAALENAAAS
jgi:hypothetical protein